METSQSDRVFELAAELFSVLATPLRLRIVCALLDGEANVSDLMHRLAITQPAASQHLGVLYRARVVGRRRDGQQMLYRIANAQVRGLCAELVCRQASLGSPLLGAPPIFP